jgi:hypothetical protein
MAQPKTRIKPPPSGSINADLLPQMLRDLIRVLGEASAFDLCQRRGGARLRVPAKVDADSPLVHELGLPVVTALAAEWAGIDIDVPKYDKVTQQLRHERVRQLKRRGLSVNSVAVACGYSRRHVINITNADEELAAARAQIGLFDRPGAGTAPAAKPGSAADPFGLAALHE